MAPNFGCVGHFTLTEVSYTPGLLLCQIPVSLPAYSGFKCTTKKANASVGLFLCAQKARSSELPAQVQPYPVRLVLVAQLPVVIQFQARVFTQCHAHLGTYHRCIAGQ